MVHSASPDASTWIVIPCFNEALRLDFKQINMLLAASFQVVLVDDGSVDSTLSDIQRYAETENHIHTVQLERNQGKGEAIRAGMTYSLEQGATQIGYLDADHAVPAEEMLRLIAVLNEHEKIDVVLGSRWLHLGVEIKRSAVRHYASRVFATFASNILQIPVYDTQCGAKVFRVTPHLVHVVSSPFASRWAFDVELLGRLLKPAAGREGYRENQLLEVPLNQWREVSGSKLGAAGLLLGLLELFGIWRRLRAPAQ